MESLRKQKRGSTSGIQATKRLLKRNKRTEDEERMKIPAQKKRYSKAWTASFVLQGMKNFSK
jgi:hypothetical protein